MNNKPVWIGHEYWLVDSVKGGLLGLANSKAKAKELVLKLGVRAQCKIMRIENQNGKIMCVEI